MTKHPRYQHSLEELFVQVYVLVDDWLKDNEKRFSLPKQRSQVAAYSELFTIAIVGEVMAQPYESVWYWLVGQSYRNLFPRLPEYSRYHRVVRNAERLWAELAVELVRGSGEAFKIVDAHYPLLKASGLSGRSVLKQARVSLQWGWFTASTFTL